MQYRPTTCNNCHSVEYIGVDKMGYICHDCGKIHVFPGAVHKNVRSMQDIISPTQYFDRGIRVGNPFMERS